MAASVDGRIVVDDWPDSAAVRREYELVHASYNADGWICGRVTMEPFAKGMRSEQEVRRKYTGRKARDDFSAPGQHESFAFAVDPSGRLAWESNNIDGDHVVAILSGRVSNEYLAFLRERGVSYILAGTNDVDLSLALKRIRERFGVRTLMLEGGGRINGGMLREGLIDEVSLLLVPVADGGIGTPALFDIDEDGFPPPRLRLKSVEQRTAEILWVRYGVEAKK
jgi:2,5-diamino-6-(ribosylamino)-4(3H)-pyrimidinone 5'-phosphate reductase